MKRPAGSLPRARSYEIPHPAFEPTIGIDPEGTIFVSSLETNTRVEVIRSTDGGRRWEVVSPELAGVGRHLVSLDPYVYVDPTTARVFTIDLTVACSYLSLSDDRGASWVTNPLACGRPVNDHQTLFTGTPRDSEPVVYPNLVYYCFNDVVSSSCSKSIDGGLTFVPTGAPAFEGVQNEDGLELCGGLHGQGTTTKNGIVLLPRDHCGAPFLAISSDEGWTWDRIRVASAGHVSGPDPAVAADRAGNIYYVWIGTDRLPYLTISKNGGKSWTRPAMIAAPGVQEANLPTIAAGPRGEIAIGYVGSPNSPFQRCKPDCNEPYSEVAWHGYMTVSLDALVTDPVFFSATANAPDDPLLMGTCGPGRCGAMWDFIDVAMDRRGQPWFAYVDAFKQGRSLETGTGLVATMTFK